MSKKKHENRQSGDIAFKPQPAETKQKAKPKPARELPWHPATRTLVSLLVVLHVLAVFVAPWNFLTPTALPPGYIPPTDSVGRQLPPPRDDDPIWQQPRIVRGLSWFFRHYQNLAYLNHGYEFFAPDPSGTHLIEYLVTQPDGAVVEGHFPDLKEQWPRLYYHRKMMLAEQIAGMGESAHRKYAEHLAGLHGGRSRVDWVVHLLLSPEQVLEGRKLGENSTYRVLASVAAAPPDQEQISQEQMPQGESVTIPGDAR